MLIDAIPAFASGDAPHESRQARAISSFLRFIEKKLGVSVVRDARIAPYERPDLATAWKLASDLHRAGVIETHILPADPMPDEPHLKLWYAFCTDSTRHRAGGASLQSDLDALMATLAEALERTIWFTETDYFRNPIRARANEMRKPHIAPERFASFSPEQRTGRGNSLSPDASYLWVEGRSLVNNSPIYLPAQTVSGYGRHAESLEPLIRQRTTNGLATWPTQTGAQLAGALELIERDAYMIMWLNQLTLPRLDLSTILDEHDPLARFIARSERYNLKIHIVPMITDAPTHAICAVVEDTTGNQPRFTVGLKAHRSLATAIEKATTEALRARRGYRGRAARNETIDPTTPVEQIQHHGRVDYWAHPAHAEQLEFLIRGEKRAPVSAAWDVDSIEQHLHRIVAWCRSAGYEYASVPLTGSAKNPTTMHVEMTVIPELQPLYVMESHRMFGGTRLREIPEAFGYAPRDTLFSDAPHPFL